MRQRRPILLNSCAEAATAAEARFRIDGREQTARSSRVIALDAGAGEVVRRIAGQGWQGARFLVRPGMPAADDVVLQTVDGDVPSPLHDVLDDADMVVMIAQGDDGADVAAAIGDACVRRGIMTGGLVVGDDVDVRAAVSALRPHAQVLLVSRDSDDVPAVLTALRA